MNISANCPACGEDIRFELPMQIPSKESRLQLECCHCNSLISFKLPEGELEIIH